MTLTLVASTEPLLVTCLGSYVAMNGSPGRLTRHTAVLGGSFIAIPRRYRGGESAFSKAAGEIEGRYSEQAYREVK